jgi:hypothetical protein
VLRNNLEDGGYIMIEDMFYENYFTPTMFRTLVFHLLIIQNFFKIKIPVKEFLLNLQICFYTRAEFIHFLENNGFEIIDTKEYSWEPTLRERLLLLKNWGFIQIIARKKT